MTIINKIALSLFALALFSAVFLPPVDVSATMSDPTKIELAVEFIFESIGLGNVPHDKLVHFIESVYNSIMDKNNFCGMEKVVTNISMDQV